MPRIILRPATPAMPAFFETMCVKRFHTSLALAKRLWRVFWPVMGEEAREQLLILSTTPCLAAAQRFAALVPPAALLSACEKLFPRHRRRDPEVVKLEERILFHTNRDGGWYL